ncbi:MAG: glycoside hydrolase family 9 protein [Bacteroidia bacterium]|nr:glycoside hydrolase family 9 protein [Bacteroidia bacterium]
MKSIFISLIICTLIHATSCRTETRAWIRINQLGYRTDDIKVAVFLSKEAFDLQSFKVIEVSSGEVAVTFKNVVKSGSLDPFISCYRLPFTDLKKSGIYRIVAGNAISPDFRIADDVYDGTADFLLNYMRQQRCGYNPFVKDSCHMEDGYVIYGKSDDSAHIDVTGGWHDAADYLQYVATSANAIYQMLFAYSENPTSFGDKYLSSGLPGTDGVPDVLNESKWGLDWLIKMNPGTGIMYNQIADDRDHIGFRFPNNDTAKYGKGRERPVYFCTGEPQGLFRYKNRTTGIASTAGKFSSAFAKGAEVYKSINPEFSDLLMKKAIAAFNFGLEHPGVCQTAPGTAPYFYEEDNWVDDMELAAIELYNLTQESEYLDYAIEFGRKELVTPWIGSDTARHYQWYPFVNMGHPGLARQQKIQNEAEFAGYMKKGLDLTELKAKNNPFHIGIPFIWCSNNLIAAIVTQAHLYSEISGNNSFAELEAAHRDWLFGCNPWGTSMIVGLPENGDYPINSHSSYVVKGGQVNGGLVDGPVYSTIFNSHNKYISLSKEDEYAQFQTKLAVYHDDFADYSTNECTMDGTASLVYYLSALQSSSKSIYRNPNITMVKGAIVRMDTTKRYIYLCFTAHDFADGFDMITRTLNNHKIKASFFLTGDFCRTPGYEKIISRLKTDGHYIGPHSDKHLLYCSWGKRDSLLVTKNEFISDIAENYKALEKLGISRKEALVFLPPYEWYNDTIANWTNKVGLKLVNNSYGTITNQDWTFPEKRKPYYSSDSLMNNFLSYENEKGMNGYILLIHPGTDPRRTDKFYLRLDSILTYLENKNYSFHSFSEIN